MPYLINTARAAIVDQAVMIDFFASYRSGVIKGRYASNSHSQISISTSAAGSTH